MGKNPPLINKKEELKTACYNLLFIWVTCIKLHKRVIDNGAIESYSFDTLRIIHSEWNVSPKGKLLQFKHMCRVFSINRVFFHQLPHPPFYSGNFADYANNFTRMIVTLSPSLKTKRAFSFIPLSNFRRSKRQKLPLWSFSKGLIRWCLTVIMKFTYSFSCW